MSSIHGPTSLPGLLSACLLFVPACTAQSFELTREGATGAEPGPRMSHDPPSGTSQRMARHFADVREIQQAVIAGDLVSIRTPARRLVERTDPHPESWGPFVAVNRKLADATLAARSLEDAARAAAGLMNNCGECHAAVGLGPDLVTATMPSADARDAPRSMLRHQWAAERMGDALVARSAAAWRAGAEVLADAPLLPSALPTDVNYPAEFDALVARVHELGARAPATVAWSDRVALYGDLLATCAVCHHGLVSNRSLYLARSPSRAGVE